MFLEESPEQQQLRAELRQYYRELLTDEVRAGLAEGGEGGEAWGKVVRQIGKDGWLGIGWPSEFGGQGRPATDQFIFFDETRRAGAPFPFVTINTVGPTIMRFGTDEQKTFFLPQILAGELNFAIGYTEPEAGTDLASLRTRARARRRGVRRERGEDLHQRRRPGRLHLAGRADRPGRAQAQGHLDPVRPDDVDRVRVVDHPHGRRADDDADVLRQRARARGQPRRGRERGLAHDHHPAQPRAGGPGRLERAGHLALRGHRRLGGHAADGRRQDADRPGLGADGSRQVPRRARGHVVAQLADGRARRRRRAHRGGVVVDQGLRDRADSRGGAPAAGGGGHGRLPRPRFARRAAAGPPRGHGAPGAGQHVRGRGERGAARDRGHGGARHDAGAR